MNVSGVMTRMPHGLRAFVLALTVIPVLFAGVLPTCADGLYCPVTPDVPAVHSQMPCCEGGPSFAPRTVARMQPATFAGHFDSPQMWAPAAWVAQPAATFLVPPRVLATLATASRSRQETSSPIFLLNAQFLI